MKHSYRKSLRNLLFIATLILSSITIHAQGKGMSTPKNHSENEIWFNQPASTWLEALPLGNGTLGAMVYGHPGKERIQFNENSLVTGTPDLVGFYQPFGNILFDFAHENASDYKRSLELSNAIHTITYQHNSTRFKREYFVSQPDQALIMMITADKKSSVNMAIALKDTRTSQMAITSNSISFRGKLQENGMEYMAKAIVNTKGGKLINTDSSIVVANADTVLVYMSAITSFKKFNVRDVFGELPVDMLSARLGSVSKQPYKVLRARHTNDFGKLFNRVKLNLGTHVSLPTDQRLLAYNKASKDNGMEALLFQYGRYLLISSSRKGGLPANLQGLWNNEVKPAWYSQYTTNINIQMNYWSAEVTNIPETHFPMFDWVENLGKVQKTSKDSVLKTDVGWVAYSTNNTMGGSSKWRLHRPGSAWLSQHFWEHYAFTLDTVFLRNRAYPFLKEIVKYWEGHLVEGKNGQLITPDGWSPEHGPGKNEQDKSPYPGASYDQQIIYDLLTNYIAAAKVLGLDQDYRKKVESMQQRLLKPQIGRWGQLQEWMEDWDDSTDHHRHNSHMFAVHPGKQIDPIRTPELTAAVRRSLKARGNISTGWSSAWKINIWARLFDGDKAHLFVRELLKPVIPGVKNGEKSGVHPNLFGSHPPFQMDANFGYTAGIAEMLLQSHNDIIHILPALPSVWDQGEVSGLKARGNVLVGMKWSNGKLTNLSLKAASSGNYVILYAGKKMTLRLMAGKTHLLDGRLAFLYQSSKPVNTVAKADYKTDWNWWKNDKFGMFVHWGPVSLTGKEISWSRSSYGTAKYDSLYLKFNPTLFDAKKWIAAAKLGGMKYIVFTAKHHDGFCNWDTKTSTYNIMNTPYGKDVCKALANAAHEAGIKIGWYYSPAEWKDPDCRNPEKNELYVKRATTQLQELLSNYGKIDLLWIDFEGGPVPGDPAVFYSMAKKLQPGIIVNNRLDVLHTDESHGWIGKNGDYATPEGFVAGYSAVPWETCTNLGHQWAWRFNDNPRSLKEVSKTLLKCIGGNGNLLLNVGPDSTGMIPDNFLARLKELGNWVKGREKTLFNVNAGSYTPTNQYVSTRKGNDLYLHFFDPVSDTIEVPKYTGKIVSAKLLNGQKISYQTTGNKLRMIIPVAARDSIATTIHFTTSPDGHTASMIAPFSTSGSIAYSKKSSASSSIAQMLHDPSAAFDDNPNTHWKLGRRADVDFAAYYGSGISYRGEEVKSLYNNEGWLQIDLGKPTQVQKIRLMEYVFLNSSINSFSVSYLDGDKWISLLEGNKMGVWEQSFKPVQAQYFRLQVNQVEGFAGVKEFQLF